MKVSKMFPAPVNEGRVFVGRSWMEGGTSCTAFTTYLWSYTERLYWSGRVYWWVYAGQGKRPRKAPSADEVSEDTDLEGHWWMEFSDEAAMLNYLHAQERAILPLFRSPK